MCVSTGRIDPQLVYFIIMSSSTTQIDEHPNVPAENADWRKAVDDLQTFLTSKARILLSMVEPGGYKAIEDVVEQGPVVMSKLRELEKLQEQRGNEILTSRQERLAELGRKLDAQQKEKNKLEHDLTSLSHQRMHARDKLNDDKEAAKGHEQRTRGEDVRLNERKASLDTRQQGLESREADLIRSNEILTRDLQSLAERREEDRKREEHNKKRTIRINKRLDVLADYGVQKNREVAELTSKFDDLKFENDHLKDANNALEGRVDTLQNQLDTSVKENERLVKSNESLDMRLGTLKDTEAELAKLNAGLTHLSCVVLPEKQAIILTLKDTLGDEKKLASESKKDLTRQINDLGTKLQGLEGIIREHKNQLSRVEQEKTSLQAVADKSLTTAEDDYNRLLQDKAGLEAVIHNCELNHSDIDEIRQQVLDLQKVNAEYRPSKKDFEMSKRLQDKSNIMVKDLQNEIANLKSQMETDQEMHVTTVAEKDEIIHDMRGSCEAAEDKVKNLSEELDDNINEFNELIDERDKQVEEKDVIVEERGKLLIIVGETREELDRNEGINRDLHSQIEVLTAQLHSCRCSGDRISRKRSHGQMELGGEEASSSQHRARRLGKARESPPEINIADRFIELDDPFEALDDPARPARLGSTGQDDLDAAGPVDRRGGIYDSNAGPFNTDPSNVGLYNVGPSNASPSNAGPSNIGPLPNIGQPRQPLFLRHGTTWRIEDVLNRHSTAHPIPQAVLTRLRGQIREWDLGTRLWRKGGDVGDRRCAHSYSWKKGTAWKDDDSHQACLDCTEARRLCVVAAKGERIELLPLCKDQDTWSIGDEDYWLVPRAF